MSADSNRTMPGNPTAAPENLELRAHDGKGLAGYRWRAAAPRGLLVLLHGYAEHAERHAALAEAAAAAGFDVWSFDQRNHGRSPGEVRGSVRGFEPALLDLGALLDRAEAEVPGFRPFLFGHSMGGAIALRYALDHPERLAGLVLSAPFLVDGADRPAWMARLAGPLSRVLPTLPTARLSSASISRDPAEVKRYESDPLIYRGGVRADAGATMLEQGEALLERAPRLAVDTLLIHGSDDKVASVKGSRELAGATDRVELHVIDGAFHEMHHDPAASGTPEAVRRLVLDWLDAHAADAGR